MKRTLWVIFCCKSNGMKRKMKCVLERTERKGKEDRVRNFDDNAIIWQSTNAAKYILKKTEHEKTACTEQDQKRQWGKEWVREIINWVREGESEWEGEREKEKSNNFCENVRV